jgi:hypothetical protein
VQGRAALEFQPRYCPSSGKVGLALVGDI